MQFLVYTFPITNRKEYIFKFLLGTILGISFKITDHKNEFIEFKGPKFSYAYEPLEQELHFKETHLLSESTVYPQELSFVEYEGYVVPFPSSESLFPFDIFAASFYLLTRYEEYTNPKRDKHGRFQAKDALAFEKGFLDRSVIDVWAFYLLKILLDRFPDLNYKRRNFKIIPTLDIDRPYYLKTDNFFKKALKYLLQLLKGNFQILKKDPFDVYQQVYQWDKQFGIETLYFILMGNKHQLDVAPNTDNKKFRWMITNLFQKHKLGIHPSYQSNFDIKELFHEKKELEKIGNASINISRQHYLKFNLPETYRNLISAKINQDYSLCYADLPGFRASTCTPFFWYDLTKEKETELLINPTVIMDQTLRSYMQLNPKEAWVKIEALLENVKQVNGVFISLWHNESINDFEVWKGWKEIYIQMLKWK